MSSLAPVVLSLTVPALFSPSVAPLQEVVLTDVRGARVQVSDALGRRYVDMPAQGEVRFRPRCAVVVAVLPL